MALTTHQRVGKMKLRRRVRHERLFPESNVSVPLNVDSPTLAALHPSAAFGGNEQTVHGYLSFLEDPIGCILSLKEGQDSIIHAAAHRTPR